MITPSFGLTATERVLPKLALDFTTATLDSRVTFTRSGNTATYTNSSGVITAINADLPRFDYNPTTLICQGLLIEEARTNIVLNSLINGTNLSTQIVTTSATAYTLSFYGTGSIVLTGTHNATVTGTGVYPSRKTYTFTPTAGALTLTVLGTVQYAQLEAGAFATSYIPTTTTALTRNADVATMTGTNFSSWFNATQGTFYAEGYGGTVRGCFAAIDDDTMNNRYQMNISAVGPYSPNFAAVSGGVVSADLYMSAVTQSANIKQVGAYKLDSFALSAFGATPQTDTSGVLPVSVSMLRFGRLQNGNNPLNGCLKKFYYWPQRLTDAEVQAFSK